MNNWCQRMDKRCFQTVVLEKTFESLLDCKEIKPVNPKGNKPWIFIGRTDDEAEATILWPTDAKSWYSAFLFIHFRAGRALTCCPDGCVGLCSVLAVHARASHSITLGSHCPAKGMIGKKMSVSLNTWSISETVSLHMNADLNTDEVKAGMFLF